MRTDRVENQGQYSYMRMGCIKDEDSSSTTWERTAYRNEDNNSRTGEGTARIIEDSNSCVRTDRIEKRGQQYYYMKTNRIEKRGQQTCENERQKEPKIGHIILIMGMKKPLILRGNRRYKQRLVISGSALLFKYKKDRNISREIKDLRYITRFFFASVQCSVPLSLPGYVCSLDYVTFP